MLFTKKSVEVQKNIGKTNTIEKLFHSEYSISVILWLTCIGNKVQVQVKCKSFAVNSKSCHKSDKSWLESTPLQWKAKIGKKETYLTLMCHYICPLTDGGMFLF